MTREERIILARAAVDSRDWCAKAPACFRMMMTEWLPEIDSSCECALATMYRDIEARKFEDQLRIEERRRDEIRLNALKEKTYTVIVESTRWRQLLDHVDVKGKEEAVAAAKKMCERYPSCLIFVKYSQKDGQRGYLNSNGKYSLVGDNWN